MNTSNIEELIKQLREGFNHGDSANVLKAADLLQSQAERIENLEAKSRLEQAQTILVRGERYILRAQLAEIEKTEPVAWINLAASSKMFRFLAPTEEDGTVVKDWQPLFTHPMPARPQDHEIRELVDRLTAIAKEYGQTQQLRERIAQEIRPFTFTKPAQDKSNNYLNGYCTGRTDLLKEQAASQPAQGGQHE